MRLTCEAEGRKKGREGRKGGREEGREKKERDDKRLGPSAEQVNQNCRAEFMES
jgi:hypothetical protein